MQHTTTIGSLESLARYTFDRLRIRDRAALRDELRAWCDRYGRTAGDELIAAIVDHVAGVSEPPSERSENPPDAHTAFALVER